MAPKSTGEESSVALRRISALLSFLGSDVQSRSQPSSSASVTANATHFDPVLLPCSLHSGGIQGFKWYWRGLKIDKDGDIADEFLDKISFL